MAATVSFKLLWRIIESFPHFFTELKYYEVRFIKRSIDRISSTCILQNCLPNRFFLVRASGKTLVLYGG
jgi:hypothetical protein